jgi:hypothetical protein
MTDLLALDIATTKSIYYAYALYAGRQLLPCYIGIGKGDRLDQHMRVVRRGDSKRGNLRKFRTLWACWRKGIAIRAERLAFNLSLDQACATERMLIAIYGRRDLGTGCLLNASAGGAGLKNIAPSTRVKLAEAGRRQMAKPGHRELMNAKKKTPEARARSSAAAKNRPPPSSESRARMAKACRRNNESNPKRWAHLPGCRRGKIGYKHTDQARISIAEALRMQWQDADVRERRSAFFKNQNSNPELKAVIDAARFGRKTTLGKKWSPETRARMSQSQKLRRQREREQHADLGT